MAKKAKKAAPGVPEWVVTYGDMMSLLLCFFILLAAFSELKKEHEYQRVITAVKEAFGYSGGVGVMPTDDPPLRSMIEQLETLANESLKESKVSEASSKGIHGKQSKVSKTPEGMVFTIGGGSLFAHNAVELSAEGRSRVLQAAKLLAGRRNRISVRGHAASSEGGEGSAYSDPMDLSYARARSVFDLLVNEGGLNPDTLVPEAYGDSRPLKELAYSLEEQADNRRVDVIMTEQIVPGGTDGPPGGAGQPDGVNPAG